MADPIKKKKKTGVTPGYKAVPKVKKSVKRSAPMAAKDTVHVGTTGNYKIVVKKGSNHHKQSKKNGNVINEFRPDERVKGGADTDPRSVKNYNKKYKK